jgi:hypothetical protein
MIEYDKLEHDNVMAGKIKATRLLLLISFLVMVIGTAIFLVV